MAERSIFWTTSGVGDGAANYTQADLINWMRRTFIGSSFATQGVLRGFANQLAVTGTASPVAVATGGAVVYGFPYENDSSLNLTVATPSVGTTGGHVILRTNWAAQTVRLLAVRNTDGAGGIPALTQTANTTWEIRLASFTITTAGVIALTDTRVFATFSSNHVLRAGDTMDGTLTVPTLAATTGTVTTLTAPTATITTATITTLNGGTPWTSNNDGIRRQGGSASDWSTGGSSNYTPTAMLTQVGSRATAANTVAVTYPVAFSQPPVLLLAVSNSDGASLNYATQRTSVTASGFSVTVVRSSDGVISSGVVHWIAIGPP